MAPINRSEYRFESSKRKTYRNDKICNAELDKLKNNIGIDEKEKKYDPLLLEFVVHYNLNIEWYQKRIKHEKRIRNFIFWLGAFLLLLIPSSIIILELVEKITPTLPVNTGIALTGLIGFYSSIKEWNQKRSVISVFHYASSSLKKELYEFESEWVKKFSSKAEIENFKNAVTNKINTAKIIQHNEERNYFEKTTDIKLDSISEHLEKVGDKFNAGGQK